MLLFLVRRGNSGIFSLRTSNMAFHGRSGQILGGTELVNVTALASFLGSCQFRFGGIAKAPGEHAGKFLEGPPCNCVTEKNCSDPYHTYLSLAAIAIFPLSGSGGGTWAIKPLDPLINAELSTAQWARDHIPLKST
jgi:geranylgeranyl transferase type-1 subunit beta